jgi:predicted Zn-dependent peptidase
MAEPLTREAHRFEGLEKPALDDRAYRVITLPNQLEALLIHDASADKASAALDVNVGSFSDAKDMPGIAHAVEHLLFMGTEKVNSNFVLPGLLQMAVCVSNLKLTTFSVSQRERLQSVSQLTFRSFECLHCCDIYQLLL